MKKITIGIPRAFYYYYYGDLYKRFFEKLGFDVVISPKTNKAILQKGMFKAESEMCLPMKILFGHITYLQNKCDYIVVPRIDNYGFENQTCTNFLALYDLVHNVFDIPILNYNINYEKDKTELDGFIQMGNVLYMDTVASMKAYEEAKEEIKKEKRRKHLKQTYLLNQDRKKILIVSHPYNLEDALIGKDILHFLEKEGVIVLKSYDFDSDIIAKRSFHISKTLYWKFSKEELDSLLYTYPKIDGIIFLSSFPCALDSLVYELTMRKVKKPYLHLIVDDLNAMAGIETRLESFLDILEHEH